MLRTERQELEHKFRRLDISQDTDCVMDATKRFLLTFSEQCKFRLVFLSQRPCARSQLNPAVENNAGEQTARAWLQDLGTGVSQFCISACSADTNWPRNRRRWKLCTILGSKQPLAGIRNRKKLGITSLEMQAFRKAIRSSQDAFLSISFCIPRRTSKRGVAISSSNVSEEQTIKQFSSN